MEQKASKGWRSQKCLLILLGIIVLAVIVVYYFSSLIRTSAKINCHDSNNSAIETEKWANSEYENSTETTVGNIEITALKKLKIDIVNSLSADEFKEIFKNVVELRPKAADAVESRRPFGRLLDLIFAFVDYLEHLSVEDKVAVLQSHPDLAGKLLAEDKLSDDSAAEHAFAGLNHLSEQQQSELTQLNAEYSKKFGFPFVISVRQSNKIERILDGLRERLPNTRSEEINNGIDEVKIICQIRIESIVEL